MRTQNEIISIRQSAKQLQTKAGFLSCVEELHSVGTKYKGISFTLCASRPSDLCSNLTPGSIPENDLARLLVSATENTQYSDPVCQLLALTSEGNASDMHK